MDVIKLFNKDYNNTDYLSDPPSRRSGESGLWFGRRARRRPPSSSPTACSMGRNRTVGFIEESKATSRTSPTEKTTSLVRKKCNNLKVDVEVEVGESLLRSGLWDILYLSISQYFFRVSISRNFYTPFKVRHFPLFPRFRSSLGEFFHNDGLLKNKQKPLNRFNLCLYNSKSRHIFSVDNVNKWLMWLLLSYCQNIEYRIVSTIFFAISYRTDLKFTLSHSPD